MIVNRIGIDHGVYDTSFISKMAAYFSRRHQPGYGTYNRQPSQTTKQIPAGSDQL